MDVQWLTFRVSIDGKRLDRAACRQVRRDAMRRAIEHRPWIRFVHPVMTLAALVFGFAASWLLGKFMLMAGAKDIAGLPRLAIVLVVAIPVMGFIWMMFALVNRKLLQRSMRRAMRDLGYNLCPACGYWLRGLAADTGHCPECGSPREGRKASGSEH